MDTINPLPRRPWPFAMEKPEAEWCEFDRHHITFARITFPVRRAQCCGSPVPWLLTIGCCAWFTAQLPSIASADSPIEAMRPLVVQAGESTRDAYALLSANDANGARAVMLTAIAAHAQDAGQRWRKYSAARRAEHSRLR